MRNRKIITSPRRSATVKVDKPNELVTVALLSENHGHRMKSYGPISLIKIGSKTLLEKQIDAIRNTFPNCEIIICAGFEASKTAHFIKSKFHDLNIRVVENQMHYNSNCCESARLCLNNTMNNKVLICSGGILFSAAHLQTIDLDKTCVLSQKDNFATAFEIGVIENDNMLETFSIGIKHNYWSEIFFLNGGKEINHFLSIISQTDYKNRFIFEAINEMNKKYPVTVIKSHKNLQKINNLRALREVTV